MPTSFTLKWSSGIDSDRVGWPATYDIYAYGEGGTDLIASNVSCNPDGSGNCQLAISNLISNALYHWRVVAKLDIGVYAPNPYYVHSSAEFTFTTAVDANAPITFMTANLSNFLTAASCGGGLLDATGTSRGTCQRFKVEDVNGGNLNSNDVVHLKMADTYYVAAENEGGGNVTVQYTAANTWEKFTVTKIVELPEPASSTATGFPSSPMTERITSERSATAAAPSMPRRRRQARANGLFTKPTCTKAVGFS